MARRFIKFTFKIARKINNRALLHADIAIALAESAHMVETYNPMAKKYILKMYRRQKTMAKFYRWLIEY